ncbi:IclR family transcriptional regulator [Amycolatopsis sp. WAC 04169]|uniref:helix-turn-helix domain-containing protein n=1 Tax=Amycolatopsis sp. WAC 04169 TaxID=2203197 RepID=UPI000F78D8DB|nr:helix-turn-helix domain-containing protein [Amycolatopsis sp. WAC 04169]RSN20590.1 IclR family transcriptional regulator [Amycolatopsis sp. WAC 04169]
MSISPASLSGNPMRSKETLSAVDKAMLVLNAVIAHESSATLAVLTRETGLAKATVHRVLNVLHEHGVVARTEAGYLAGEQLVDAGLSANADLFAIFRRESTPFLLDLHRASGETASLSVLVGDTVHHLNQLYGHRTCRLPEQVAARKTSAESAITRILLAHSSRVPAAVARAKELAAARKTGIATSQCRSGVITTLAVAVPHASVPWPVALAVTGRTGSLDVNSTAKSLRGTAFAFAKHLRVVATRASVLSQEAG